MPCYRCGTRQVDPEPGKPSPWHRGVVREHQVLICPDCYPTALTDLGHCTRCDSVRLIKRLDRRLQNYKLVASKTCDDGSVRCRVLESPSDHLQKEVAAGVS